MRPTVLIWGRGVVCQILFGGGTCRLQRASKHIRRRAERACRLSPRLPTRLLGLAWEQPLHWARAWWGHERGRKCPGDDDMVHPSWSGVSRMYVLSWAMQVLEGTSAGTLAPSDSQTPALNYLGPKTARRL